MGEDGYDVDRLEGDEDKEEAMVLSAYTTVDPWTMMVKSLHTIVAYRAMRGSRWSENATGKTILE